MNKIKEIATGAAFVVGAIMMWTVSSVVNSAVCSTWLGALIVGRHCI